MEMPPTHHPPSHPPTPVTSCPTPCHLQLTLGFAGRAIASVNVPPTEGGGRLASRVMKFFSCLHAHHDDARPPSSAANIPSAPTLATRTSTTSACGNLPSLGPSSLSSSSASCVLQLIAASRQEAINVAGSRSELLLIDGYGGVSCGLAASFPSQDSCCSYLLPTAFKPPAAAQAYLRELCEAASADPQLSMMLTCAALALQARRPYQMLHGITSPSDMQPRLTSIAGGKLFIQACSWVADATAVPVPALILAHTSEPSRRASGGTAAAAAPPQLSSGYDSFRELVDLLPAMVTLCSLSGRVLYQEMHQGRILPLPLTSSGGVLGRLLALEPEGTCDELLQAVASGGTGVRDPRHEWRRVVQVPAPSGRSTTGHEDDDVLTSLPPRQQPPLLPVFSGAANVSQERSSHGSFLALSVAQAAAAGAASEFGPESSDSFQAGHAEFSLDDSDRLVPYEAQQHDHSLQRDHSLQHEHSLDSYPDRFLGTFADALDRGDSKGGLASADDEPPSDFMTSHSLGWMTSGISSGAIRKDRKAGRTSSRSSLHSLRAMSHQPEAASTASASSMGRLAKFQRTMLLMSQSTSPRQRRNNKQAALEAPTGADLLSTMPDDLRAASETSSRRRMNTQDSRGRAFSRLAGNLSFPAQTSRRWSTELSSSLSRIKVADDSAGDKEGLSASGHARARSDGNGGAISGSLLQMGGLDNNAKQKPPRVAGLSDPLTSSMDAASVIVEPPQATAAAGAATVAALAPAGYPVLDTSLTKKEQRAFDSADSGDQSGDVSFHFVMPLKERASVGTDSSAYDGGLDMLRPSSKADTAGVSSALAMLSSANAETEPLDTRRWHEVMARLVPGPDGDDGLALLLLQTDVTDRVNMETSLAAMSEGQLSLLSTIFPRHIIEFLSTTDMSTLSAHFGRLASLHENVTILFLDIVGFTVMSKSVSPSDILAFLNQLFTLYDVLADKHKVQKVDTAGDCYIASVGIMGSGGEDVFYQAETDDASKVVERTLRIVAFGKDMLRCSKDVRMPHNGEPVSVRIGLHTGPCVSGLVGTKVPKFSVFGDTINTASRMESTCIADRIQVSASTYQLLLEGGCSSAEWQPTGGLDIKGKGTMETFLWCPPPDDSIEFPQPLEVLHVLQMPRLSAGGATQPQNSSVLASSSPLASSGEAIVSSSAHSYNMMNPGLRLMIQGLRGKVRRESSVNYMGYIGGVGGAAGAGDVSESLYGRASTSHRLPNFHQGPSLASHHRRASGRPRSTSVVMPLVPFAGMSVPVNAIGRAGTGQAVRGPGSLLYQEAFDEAAGEAALLDEAPRSSYDQEATVRSWTAI